MVHYVPTTTSPNLFPVDGVVHRSIGTFLYIFSSRFWSVKSFKTKTTLLETWLWRRAETVELRQGERSFIAISALCIAVESLGSKMTASPSAAADSEKRQICSVCVLVRGQRCKRRRSSSKQFSHRGSHFRLRGDWGRGRDLT